MTLTTGLRYDTNAGYEVRDRDVEYQRIDGTPMLARIYEPQGSGPFPMLIDVHGGGWRQFDRTRDEPVDSDLASHGLLVASVDFRTSADAPHPADMVDINYAIRWFKAHAAEFNASPEAIGAIGFSSGAHQVLLAGLRPSYERYTTTPLEEAPDVDATLDFVIPCSPPINIPSLYMYGSRIGANPERLHYFGDEAGRKEASPYHIVVSAEKNHFPAVLIPHGLADKTDPPEDSVQFAHAYAAEGGFIELCLFPKTPHIFLNPGLVEPSESTKRGLAIIKSFISRQVDYKANPLVK